MFSVSYLNYCWPVFSGFPDVFGQLFSYSIMKIRSVDAGVTMITEKSSIG